MFGIPDAIRDLLGIDAGNITVYIITVVVVASVGLLTPLLSIWLERKVSARFQDRIGPNRTGPYGLLQAPADAVKLLTKEQIMPIGADKFVFMFAPILMVISVIMIMAVIPINEQHIGTDLSIAMLYIVSIGSLSTIAILMGGWASNNKYALLGAFRVIAQMISYEVPMVLALLVPILLAGTMSSQGIIEAQSGIWFFFLIPVSALIFFISSTAEVGRQPFDLLEAESEIVAGYNIEYSGMPFAMFYLGEWLHAVLICVLTAMIFFGGWRGPGVESLTIFDFQILGPFYLILKTALLYFIHMWVRFTVPRLRIDHLMSFNWKFLVPLSVVNLLVMAFIWRIIPAPSESGFVAELPRAVAMFGANLLLGLAVLTWARRYTGKERAKVEALVDETDYTPTTRRLPQTAAGD
jgi:NADH-quinone oxidoreductase subunit H